MKSIFFTVFFLLFSVAVGKGQVTFGLHTGISGYTGIHTDFSIEVPVYHRFSLNSRASYVIGQGVMFRTGIRFRYPVFKKTEMRIGIDVGVFDQRDLFSNFWANPYFVYGGNFGVHYKLNPKWGLLGEINLLDLKNYNSQNQAILFQLGVTYSLTD